MEYTNQEILSAVLAKWVKPIINQEAVNKMLPFLPFMSDIETRIKSSGYVSQKWSIGKEISPYVMGMNERILIPFFCELTKDLPEDMLPVLVHSFVDNAIHSGGFDFMEGSVNVGTADLMRLKRLLDTNLPLTDADYYSVVE